MRRYYREDDGTIYDRRLRRHIETTVEKRIGDHYYLNPGEDDTVVIPVFDVEERQ